MRFSARACTGNLVGYLESILCIVWRRMYPELHVGSAREASGKSASARTPLALACTAAAPAKEQAQRITGLNSVADLVVVVVVVAGVGITVTSSYAEHIRYCPSRSHTSVHASVKRHVFVLSRIRDTSRECVSDPREAVCVRNNKLPLVVITRSLPRRRAGPFLFVLLRAKPCRSFRRGDRPAAAAAAASSRGRASIRILRLRGSEGRRIVEERTAMEQGDGEASRLTVRDGVTARFYERRHSSSLKALVPPRSPVLRPVYRIG